MATTSLAFLIDKSLVYIDREISGTADARYCKIGGYENADRLTSDSVTNLQTGADTLASSSLAYDAHYSVLPSGSTFFGETGTGR